MIKINPKTVQRITAWSPSRFSCWQGCARQAYFKFILKLKEPGSVAMDRGIIIHKEAEAYVGGKAAKLPASLKLVKPLVLELHAAYKMKAVKLELELAFTKTWQTCHWMAREVYCRFKLDVIWRLGDGEGPVLDKRGKKVFDPNVDVARVIDWKTGKYKPDGDYDDQLNCYAVAALTSDPTLTKATGELVFTDQPLSDGREEPNPVTREAGTLTRAGLAKAQKSWDKRVAPMLKDVRYPPCPGGTCRWCAFSKGKGGPCEY